MINKFTGAYLVLACGDYNNTEYVGMRSATKYYDTKAEVTCKRCLKKVGVKVPTAKDVKTTPVPARKPVHVPSMEMSTCRHCSWTIAKGEETNNQWSHPMGILECRTGGTVAEA